MSYTYIRLGERSALIFPSSLSHMFDSGLSTQIARRSNGWMLYVLMTLSLWHFFNAEFIGNRSRQGKLTLLSKIRVDANHTAQFESESSEGHSSSIVDLFESLKVPISFLQELEWEDGYQEGRFFTSLSHVRYISQHEHMKSTYLTFIFSDNIQGHRTVLSLR